MLSHQPVNSHGQSGELVFATYPTSRISRYFTHHKVPAFECVGHDTNLAGESPVTGSYRQV